VIALQAVVPERLAREAGVAIEDARRLVSLVHRLPFGVTELPPRAPATIRRAALERARAMGTIPGVRVVERHESAVDPFVKLVVELPDGARVETVRIPLEKPGRFSVCVSSQVGCALGCRFCRTGRMGLARNLEAWEIVEQVRAVRDVTGAPIGAPRGAPRIHGVLFQGMGEPLANLDRVLEAIAVLGEPSAEAIDLRNVTVCTSGLPDGIRRLAREAPSVRLGVSLGSALPGRRRSLMPIDDAHPLEAVLDAAADHARATHMAPLFAFTLLAGANDSDADATALAELAHRFAERAGVRPRLSLIPFNPIDEDAETPTFERSDRQDRFAEILRSRGAGGIVRYSGGGDVGAACGQLATDSRRKSPRAVADRAAPR